MKRSGFGGLRLAREIDIESAESRYSLPNLTRRALEHYERNSLLDLNWQILENCEQNSLEYWNRHSFEGRDWRFRESHEERTRTVEDLSQRAGA